MLDPVFTAGGTFANGGDVEWEEGRVSAMRSSGQRAVGRVLRWGKSGRAPSARAPRGTTPNGSRLGAKERKPSRGLGSCRTLAVHSDLKLYSFPQYSPQVFGEIAKQKISWF